MNNTYWKAVAILTTAVILARCSSSSTSTGLTSPTTATGASTTGSTTLPSIYSKFGNGMQVSLNGQTVVLTTTDLPDHASPYFGVGNAKYEAPQPGMVVNPNLIAAQSVTFRIPAAPARAM